MVDPRELEGALDELAYKMASEEGDEVFISNISNEMNKIESTCTTACDSITFTFDFTRIDPRYRNYIMQEFLLNVYEHMSTWRTNEQNRRLSKRGGLES